MVLARLLVNPTAKLPTTVSSLVTCWTLLSGKLKQIRLNSGVQMKFRKYRNQDQQQVATGARHSDQRHNAMIRLDGVSRSYGRGKNTTHALRDVSEQFAQGTFTAIMGPSGSGKSTFIQSAAGLDTPTKGNVYLGDTVLNKLKEPGLTQTRRRRIGFVFQAFNLLPALTARENILLPISLDHRQHDDAWFRHVTDTMDITSLLGSRPTELSGGQQQRVAIARAIIAQPDVVFADEPTGALDARSARSTMELLRYTVDSLNQTLIMVTHDPLSASFADRVLLLADGQIVDRLNHSSAETIATRLAALEVTP